MKLFSTLFKNFLKTVFKTVLNFYKTVLHCVLSALAIATPLCCYQQRRLALCAFIIGIR